MAQLLGLALPSGDRSEVGVHLLKERRIWFEREPVQVVIDELLDALEGKVDHHAVAKGGNVGREVRRVQEGVLGIADLSIEGPLVTPPGREEHWGHEGHLFLSGSCRLHFYTKLIIIRGLAQINIIMAQATTKRNHAGRGLTMHPRMANLRCPPCELRLVGGRGCPKPHGPKPQKPLSECVVVLMRGAIMYYMNITIIHQWLFNNCSL